MVVFKMDNDNLKLILKHLSIYKYRIVWHIDGHVNNYSNKPYKIYQIGTKEWLCANCSNKNGLNIIVRFADGDKFSDCNCMRALISLN